MVPVTYRCVHCPLVVLATVPVYLLTLVTVLRLLPVDVGSVGTEGKRSGPEAEHI